MLFPRAALVVAAAWALATAGVVAAGSIAEGNSWQTCFAPCATPITVRGSYLNQTMYYHFVFSGLHAANATTEFASGVYTNVAQFSGSTGTPDTWFVNYQIGACPGAPGTMYVKEQPNKMPNYANVYWQPSVEDLKTAAVDNKGLLNVYARVDMRTKGTCVPNGVGCGYTVTMCAPPKNFITAAYCDGIMASGPFDQVCNS